MGFTGADWRVVLVGVGVGAVETLAVWDGCIQRDGVAGDGGGFGKLFICCGGGRFLASLVDSARVGRCALSGGMRIVDRIHSLHLAAGACADLESVDLCLCESGGRGVSGVVDSARTRRPVLVMGSVIVVLAVILVTSAKVKEKTVAEALPAVEAAG